MTVSTKFAFTLTTVLLGILLVSPAALAQGTNCPVEPTQGIPIADGQIYIGPNCTITSPGDVDGFVFAGNNGETYHLVLAINGSATTNICMKIYDPNAMMIFSGCTNGGGQPAVLANLALTVTGTYTIDVTETTTATISYALSLERLHPFPPNAQQITLNTQYPGNINPITDSNAFTFQGNTDTTIQVSATLTPNPQKNVCMDVYFQDGTHIGTEQCTNGGGDPTIMIDFTPTQDGTFMAFFQVAGNDGTQTYTMEVSCLVGECNTSPIPDVSGYITLQGTPLAGVGVSLTQPGAPGPQLTTTDNNGYYQFLHAIPGADFTVLIKGPVVPQDFGKPVSGTVDDNRQDRSQR